LRKDWLYRTKIPKGKLANAPIVGKETKNRGSKPHLMDKKSGNPSVQKKKRKLKEHEHRLIWGVGDGPLYLMKSKDDQYAVQRKKERGQGRSFKEGKRWQCCLYALGDRKKPSVKKFS